MPTTPPDTTSTTTETGQARNEMGRALFAIGDRIAPKKVIARAKEQVRLKARAKAAELKERYSPVEVVRRKLGDERKVIDTRVGGPGLPR